MVYILLFILGWYGVLFLLIFLSWVIKVSIFFFLIICKWKEFRLVNLIMEYCSWFLFKGIVVFWNCSLLIVEVDLVVIGEVVVVFDEEAVEFVVEVVVWLVELVVEVVLLGNNFIMVWLILLLFFIIISIFIGSVLLEFFRLICIGWLYKFANICSRFGVFMDLVTEVIL